MQPIASALRRLTWVFGLVAACLACAQEEARAVTVSYTVNIVATGNENTLGQTATADYTFVNGTTLQIVLTETTPADAPGTPDPVGATAVLTAVGFHLPGTAVLVLVGSTAVIATGSASDGFSGGSFGAGTDVSREWGATTGAEAELDGSTSLLGDVTFDFASTVGSSGVNQFAGTNRDGPTGLDGPQGGMMNEPSDSGGIGVIDNAVVLTLILDADPVTGGNQALSLVQQTAFLLDVLTNSAVMYGSHAAFGGVGLAAPVAVPEPSAFLLLGSGLLALRTLGRRSRRS